NRRKREDQQDPRTVERASSRRDDAGGYARGHHGEQMNPRREGQVAEGQREIIDASARSRSGNANANPCSRSARGSTRRLASRTIAASPKINRSANAGAGKTAGRRSARPSPAANARLVTSCGATALIGP